MFVWGNKQSKKIRYNINNTMSVKDIRSIILDKINIPLNVKLAQKINEQAIQDAEFLRNNKLKKAEAMIYLNA